MKLLVCGGRDYSDADTLEKTLDAINKKRGIDLLINGGAPGADWLAYLWANANEIPSVTVPAKWKRHGKAAGPRRNAEMLETWKPDGVVAFPGGRGTADMIKQAKAAGVTVMEVKA